MADVTDEQRSGPTSEAEDVILRLDDIRKTYTNGVDEEVLFGVDLELRTGDFAVLVGKSGSGKTTLLNIIGLLDTPTAGRLFLDDRETSTLDEDERAQLRREYIGFIFQFHHLLPDFNVLENVLMPCRIRGKEYEEAAHDRAVEMLEMVGLGEKIQTPVNELSGGQQQRVATVRAFANDPTVVMADEPTGSLDSETSRSVMDLMRDINRETGTAFLMVTHDPELTDYADRVIELQDGRIVADEG
ncbi:ABC transporter ATP-binding protein [Salinibacter ruber]|jgi:lipoprotein-releasing system ATP-binding protein|uniref:Lipoprotein-releasing system ATP-binding protein n=1 Tax=Salinibacter ruber TaxID=146919 RepID=A0A9X2U8I9_9BACT|nr:ABC transporter ATP-binding protein [Salinibacter ruber]MCS3656748.1 lipoprotein-releasing system ATP-binding protein [Salinibacter ruber]MCS3701140.1 lipoprotein-releasing system ATP-binding protein [Salinibacter ruber]MCS3951900.1 lipoprotein-releasing system ATP-binding protein [Salinibacter ruber]MCS4118357.1 lipoprotein-releasing system ATP-binding protein [Salinibacter ruber]MCS4154279.1 lipoprotein-releasing system ATP-binding protein [Salinibacter ruber]